MRLTSGLYMRYFIGSIFVASILVGLIVDQMMRIVSSRKLMARCTRLLVMLVFLVNVCVQLGVASRLPPQAILDAIIGNDRKDNTRRIFAFASAKYGRDSRALLVDCHFYYYADFDIEGTMWFHLANRRMIQGAGSAEHLVEILFEKMKVDFIIMPVGPSSISALNDKLFRRLLTKEFTNGSLAVYSPGTS